MLKLRFAHAPGMPGTFSPHRGFAIPTRIMVTHVLWCMPGSLSSGFLWSRWRGKRSRHSRRMRNPQFYIFLFIMRLVTFKFSKHTPYLAPKLIGFTMHALDSHENRNKTSLFPNIIATKNNSILIGPTNILVYLVVITIWLKWSWKYHGKIVLIFPAHMVINAISVLYILHRWVEEWHRCHITKSMKELAWHIEMANLNAFF